MLNDQNSSSSLILSAENLLRCIFSGVISNATKLLDIRPGRNFSLNFDSRNRQPVCEKKKGKIKKKRGGGSNQGKGTLYTVYIIYSFIYSRWMEMGGGRREGGAIADSTMQRGREIGCCFCTTLCTPVFIAEISFYRRPFMHRFSPWH